MELVVAGYMSCLAAKSQQLVDDAFKQIRRGLFAVERGLEKYSTGRGPFFDGAFGVVEALCSPFVVRVVVNLKKHRGIDVLDCQDLPLTCRWMKAIREYPAVVDTTPADKSLTAIPPYIEPFFKSSISTEVRLSKPSNAEAAEQRFAAMIDSGRVHQGRSAHDRSRQARL
eukprot:TRINITY_DN100718_c0_g1_i1.p1 TRINITY_DN100718_c0_g1~~TRINITY_DN100718_c0_g1_i1.p1  ORF type:complete len:170 (+),score=23.04 TRINITY_DN100718_c0_g1_i1:415-924(+)